jgi:hypothetical protein
MIVLRDKDFWQRIKKTTKAAKDADRDLSYDSNFEESNFIIALDTEHADDTWFTYSPKTGKFGFDVRPEDNTQSLKEVLIQYLKDRIVFDKDLKALIELDKIYLNFIKQRL